MYDVTEVAHLTVGQVGCNKFLKRIVKKIVYIAIAVRTIVSVWILQY
jgi:hypothetical protein